MDSSTAAAIAAVAIAVLAFVVALAQVLQQYFVTGSLLRLCDSTVYGSLPGRGRRIWQTNQFRFRVVYTLPQLRLERGFWGVDYNDGVELHEYPVLSEWSDWKRPPPGLITAVYASVNKDTRRALRPMGWILRTTIRKLRRLFHRFMQTSVAQKSLGRFTHSLQRRDYTKYYAFLSFLRQSVHSKIAKLRTPRVIGIPESQIDLFQPTGRRSGEASWASFTRAVQDSSWKSLRFEVAEGDADRCPSDLPNVPMHVSLRDMVVLGLMLGMRINIPLIDIEVGHFSMVGSVGYITCSKHPILGSILHFTSSNMNATFGFGGSQRIMNLWVLRLRGYVPIAGRAYDARERRYLRAWDEPHTLATTVEKYNKGNVYSKQPQPKQASVSSFVNLPASSRSTPSHNPKKTGSHNVDMSQEAGRDPALGRALILYQQDLAREIEAGVEKPDDRTSMKFFPPTADEARGQLPGSQRISYDSDPDDRSPTRRSPSLALIADEDRNSLSGSQMIKYDSDPDDRSPTRRSPSLALIADEDRNSLSGSQMMKYYSHLDDRSSGRGSQSRFVIADDERDTTYDSDANSPKLRRYESRPMHTGDEPSRARHSPSHASIERMNLMRNETAKRSQSNVEQPDEESIKKECSQSIPDTPPQKTTTCPPGPTQNRRATIENDGEPEKPGNAHQSSDYGRTAPPGDAQGPRPLPKREPQSQEGRQRSESPETFFETPHGRLHNYADVITWIWFSQMDIIPGYWATPWSWYDPDLFIRHFRGTISVVLEALSGYLDTRNLQFVSEEQELEDFLKWASLGESTWPIYAINARGGVVVQAHYTKVEFSNFASSMAAVKLLYDHRWQTTEYTLPGSALEEYKTAELMMLDSWLSICGREPEIGNGGASLVHTMPSMLASLHDVFYDAFLRIDRTTSEGGLQQIQEVVRDLIEFLVRKRLSEAERLFTLVAMLRTAKVAVCVSTGPSTSQIKSILKSDARVWLV